MSLSEFASIYDKLPTEEENFEKHVTKHANCMLQRGFRIILKFLSSFSSDFSGHRSFHSTVSLASILYIIVKF